MASFFTDQQIQAVLNKYMQEAERLFKQRAQAARLELTGDLINSFKTEAATAADNFVSARLTMAAYARFRDLQRMSYFRSPPLSSMEYFVEKVGVEKFAYVPGYDSFSKPVTEIKAINRIAWGLKMARHRYPDVKRGYRGIYADPLLKDVLPNLFFDIKQQAGLTALRQLKLMFS
ncbi:hypothetical protein [Arsenicibacter rosenii]|uniref:Uncharacterized protein n=1 Tax=Arsenicibacter rosenii TaxID=1750698 RepID=A0A1S2V9S9_9BACT|nr:hypothetical protein [Arsenicibacter rosenii]OIN55432.1 hypothetical protein BLX24_30880 [Arsenicibacter rosenii]